MEKTGRDTYQCTFTFPSTGYYSFELFFPDSYDDAGQGNLNFVFQTLDLSLRVTAMTCFQHVMAEAMQGKEDTIRKVRINGSCILVSNTCAVQARGGTVYATQIAGSEPWYDVIRDVRQVSNSNVVSRYVGDWAKGFYGFVKPQGTSPMDLVDAWDDLDDSIVHLHSPNFMPFRSTGTVVVLIQPPAPSEGTFSPTQYTMSVVRALEFTTNDQFFDVEPPILRPADFQIYVEKLSKMPQFYENPLHLAAIAALIARAASFVVRYGPHAVNLAKLFITGRELAKAANGPLTRQPALD
jgi:hypothetical protein